MNLRSNKYWLFALPMSVLFVAPLATPRVQAAPPEGPPSRSAAIDAALGRVMSGQGAAPSGSANPGFSDRTRARSADQSYGSTASTVSPDGSVLGGLQLYDQSLAPRDSGYIDEVPDYHIVQSGDTLWDISGYYLIDAHAWPRLWSWNEHVTNAHWIFPGDRIRLYDPLRGRRRKQGPSLKFSRTRLPKGRGTGTYMLSQIAFVDAQDFDTSMKIIGGGEAKVMMATLDTIYMSYDRGNPPVPGERLVIYAPTKTVKSVEKRKKTIGYLVQIMGEVEVDSIARKASEGTIMNALNPIERGYRVGPLRRIFRRVDTVKPERSATGLILTTLNDTGPMPFKTKKHHRVRDPELLAGEDQFTVTDIGANDGVKVGNVLEVVRKGDDYSTQHNFDTPYQEGWPRRVIGALLVVEVQAETSLAVSIFSRQEFERGDHVELRGAGLDPESVDGLRKSGVEGDAQFERKGGKAKGKASFGLGGG